MGALSRFLCLGVAALVVAPAAVAAPLTVHARFDDATIQFGDVIRAHVTVLADPSVRRSSIEVAEDLAPLTITSAAQTARSGAVLEVTRTAMCETAACVSKTPPRPAAVVVTATLRSGKPVRATAQWPALQVRGRVTAADLAQGRPPFRTSVGTPSVTYAVAPRTLAWLLVAAAILLGAGAVTLAVTTLRRRRRTRAVPEGDALARALRLAREAESRLPPDRRRAAGLLARLLRERGERLAGAASDLAWAPPQPEAGALEGLVSDVERATAQ